MAVQKVVVIGANGLEAEYAPIQSSAGAGDAGQIPALDAIGKLDLSMMPAGIGADTLTITASEALSAGMWVNIFNNAGAANARKADSTDATKPAHGYVLAAVAMGDPAVVYMNGTNNQIPLGSFAVTDLGKPAFLATSGGTTLTPPTTSGHWLQQVGWIDAVSTLVTVNFDQQRGIVRA